jgi:hypothetical protein
MALRTKSVSVLAGLALLAAISTGRGEAQAGTIGLKGHITPLPGGSPFLYSFELDLNDLTDGPITNGSTLTVGTPTLMPDHQLSSGLVGVTGSSGTQQPPTTGGPPNEFWVVPAGGIITTPTGNPAPYNEQSSVAWQFLEGPSYNVGEVGVFTVETTSDFPDSMPPIIPNVTEINYVFTFSNGKTESGFITLSLVPEPSSVILLLMGAGAVPLVCKWAKRSQLARMK